MKAVGIIAVVLAILGFAHVNFWGCEWSELCKQQARQDMRDKQAERKFVLTRKEKEADDRFSMEKLSRAAADQARINDSEARKIEAQAKVEREQALEMARIEAAAQAEAQKNAIAAARAAAELERARAHRRPEPMNAIHFMVERGMGQPRRVHRRMPPRQPRYEMILKCGVPGRMHQC